jgi:hypothetical protein
MSPETSSLLPVTPSDPLHKAPQIFTYYTFSSPSPLALLLPFTQNFLRYVTFGTLENYILITFKYLLYTTAISSAQIKLFPKKDLLA